MFIEQRGYLEEVIEWVLEWDGDNMLTFEGVFFNLEDLDQTTDIDLWDKLKESFKKNPYFNPNDKRVVEFFSKDWREKVYWWYHIENWK